LKKKTGCIGNKISVQGAAGEKTARSESKTPEAWKQEYLFWLDLTLTKLKTPGSG